MATIPDNISNQLTSCIERVAQVMNIDKDSILTERREREFVHVRHICIYVIAKKNPQISQKTIAEIFHIKQAAVAKAIQNIEREMSAYPNSSEQIKLLLQSI